MDYRVVYDVTQQSIAWWFPGVGMLIFFVALLFFLFDRTTYLLMSKERSRVYSRSVSFMIMGFALMLSFCSLAVLMSSKGDFDAVMRQNRYSVVEGIVTEFEPLTNERGASERFVVGGVPFAYSDYLITGAFNHSSLNGGPIRGGLHVRISYIKRGDDNLILRLEIKE